MHYWAKVVSKCLQDVDVVSNFQSIIDSSELKIDKNISKDLLHAIVDLFVRIRAYSYAKDIVQKYKAKQNVYEKNSGEVQTKLPLKPESVMVV